MSRVVWGTVLLLASLALSHVAQAAGLSDNDAANAQLLANRVQWPTAQQARIEHVLGVQTVSVELAESKNSSTNRLGRVYQFNHFTSQSRVVTIDLVDGEVLSQSPINSVHLPLSQDEIQFAIDALSSSELLAEMRAEQIHRGDTPFSSLTELDVKASIFAPVSSEHVCEQQRCALLSLFDDTNTVFALEPVVQLNSGQITTLPQQ